MNDVVSKGEIGSYSRREFITETLRTEGWKGGTRSKIVTDFETTLFMDGVHEERFYFRHSSLPLRHTSSLTIITDTSIKKL